MSTEAAMRDHPPTINPTGNEKVRRLGARAERLRLAIAQENERENPRPEKLEELTGQLQTVELELRLAERKRRS